MRPRTWWLAAVLAGAVTASPAGAQEETLDYQAVRDGYISITPLQPDMTAYDALAYVEGLALQPTQ